MKNCYHGLEKCFEDNNSQHNFNQSFNLIEVFATLNVMEIKHFPYICMLYIRAAWLWQKS